MARRKAADSRYGEAGVDIDKATEALEGIKKMVRSTHTRNVLHDIGSFGALLQLGPDITDPILVTSIDGVGTKLKIAFSMNRHDTVGQDLVNHCVNDILVQGAKPVAFLDYLAMGKLDPEVVKEVVSGMVLACKENQCSLIGGETAEMPDFYREGEYDLAGCIIGVAEREDLVDGTGISPGDVIIGLTSTGLHTNGYSLARKVIFKTAGLTTKDRLPGTDTIVGDLLLEVHRSYLGCVYDLVKAKKIKGMVHITGGGFYDNIPRALHRGVKAIIDTNSWEPPPLFHYLEEVGEISREEMYRVFNMGIGFLLIVSPDDHEQIENHIRKKGVDVRLIGHIEEGKGDLHLIIPGE